MEIEPTTFNLRVAQWQSVRLLCNQKQTLSKICKKASTFKPKSNSILVRKIPFSRPLKLVCFIENIEENGGVVKR